MFNVYDFGTTPGEPYGKIARSKAGPSRVCRRLKFGQREIEIQLLHSTPGEDIIQYQRDLYRLA
jgi:hypothetical protein